MKLIKKLIHLEEKTVDDVNKLKEKLDDEFTTFSGLVRKLIRIGLESYDKKDIK